MASHRSYGKWILTGEHSVLRGYPALVFPVKKKFMESHWEPLPEELKVQFTGPCSEELSLIFWGVLERALENLAKSRNELFGTFKLHSELPVGGGLGASAALCVAVARWCEELEWIGDDEIYEFSRNLENLFHGESSGVDIAAAMSEDGMRFLKGGDRQLLNRKWQPHWYVSYCGQRGVTSECVAKVKSLIQANQGLGEKIDQQMYSATQKCEQAIASDFSEESFSQLARGIDLARDCFQQWGLIGKHLQQHMEQLLGNGAISVKPTGSGGGGYVLSLWKNQASEDIETRLNLIALSD